MHKRNVDFSFFDLQRNAAAPLLRRLDRRLRLRLHNATTPLLTAAERRAVTPLFATAYMHISAAIEQQRSRNTCGRRKQQAQSQHMRIARCMQRRRRRRRQSSLDRDARARCTSRANLPLSSLNSVTTGANCRRNSHTAVSIEKQTYFFSRFDSSFSASASVATQQLAKTKCEFCVLVFIISFYQINVVLFLISLFSSFRSRLFLGPKNNTNQTCAAHTHAPNGDDDDSDSRRYQRS